MNTQISQIIEPTEYHKRKAYFDKYRAEHKEEKDKYNEVYRNKPENKSKLKEVSKQTITCKYCGTVTTKYCMLKHTRSKKCLRSREL